jgi:hypothetical protein
MTTQATSHAVPSAQPNLLRFALRADAIFCIAAGTIGLAAAQPLSTILGIQPPLILSILGAVVVLYGAFLFYTAAQTPISLRIVTVLLVLDVIWVIDSAVLLIAGWPPLTSAGMWTIGLVAVAVAALGALKLFGLRRMR